MNTKMLSFLRRAAESATHGVRQVIRSKKYPDAAFLKLQGSDKYVSKAYHEEDIEFLRIFTPELALAMLNRIEEMGMAGVGSTDFNWEAIAHGHDE